MQTKLNCCFLAQDSATLIGNSYPVLQLGSDSITASSHVCQLGVDILSNLSFDQHVSSSRSLSALPASTNTAFIGSSFNCHTCSYSCHYSNRLLQHHSCQHAKVCHRQATVSTECCFACCQQNKEACQNCCMMNSTGLMCMNRVLFRLAVTVHQCLNGCGPYLNDLCIPVSAVAT